MLITLVISHALCFPFHPVSIEEPAIVWLWKSSHDFRKTPLITHNTLGEISYPSYSSQHNNSSILFCKDNSFDHKLLPQPNPPNRDTSFPLYTRMCNRLQIAIDSTRLHPCTQQNISQRHLPKKKKPTYTYRTAHINNRFRSVCPSPRDSSPRRGAAYNGKNGENRAAGEIPFSLPIPSLCAARRRSHPPRVHANGREKRREREPTMYIYKRKRAARGPGLVESAPRSQ